MPKAKKQPAKKRAYVKKSTKWTKEDHKKAISNLQFVEPAKITSKDTEVESLALICSIFDNWTMEQKQRNLKYIVGRYYDFM